MSVSSNESVSSGKKWYEEVDEEKMNEVAIISSSVDDNGDNNDGFIPVIRKAKRTSMPNGTTAGAITKRDQTLYAVKRENKPYLNTGIGALTAKPIPIASKVSFSQTLKKVQDRQFSKDHSRGGRVTTQLSVVYKFRGSPVTTTIDVENLIREVGIKQSIRNLYDHNNVGSFGIHVFMSLIGGLRSLKVSLSNDTHNCEKRYGKFVNGVIDPNDACCIVCLPTKFIEAGAHMDVKTVVPFSYDKISKILLGYLLLGAAFSVKKITVTNPNNVLYAPHCVVSRVIAWSVAMNTNMRYDGTDELMFKSDHSISETAFAVEVVLKHMTEVKKILLSSAYALSIGGKYTFLLPQIIGLPVEGDDIFAMTRITPSILKIYEESKNMKIECLPCIKCHLNGLIDVGDVQVHQIAYKALLEFYTQLKKSGKAEHRNTYAILIENDSVKDFLEQGTFKVMGVNGGIMMLKITMGKNYPIERYWEFKNINPMVAIFNPLVINHMNEAVKDYVSLHIKSDQIGAIGWTIEFGSECCIYHYPSQKFKGRGAEDMSINVIGKEIVKDAFNLKDFISSIDVAQKDQPEIDVTERKKFYSHADNLDYITMINTYTNKMRKFGYMDASATKEDKHEFLAIGYSDFPALPPASGVPASGQSSGK